MQFLIDGKEAALKKDVSFDLIAENRLFSGSDSYTLSITFPLRGCPGNIDIFGHIYRSELPPGDYIFDCEIHDGNVNRYGTLTLTEITDIEVKGQFLEGRSEQNYDRTFDKVYINDLDLGSPPAYRAADRDPDIAWDPTFTGYEAVALPWVSADSGMTHNFADYDKDTGKYSWCEDVTFISWQPYLLFIAKKICEAVGYQSSFGPWETHPQLSKILICNTLPDAWDLPGYARALPHWTVDEFFEKLELFLAGEFDIDHRAKTISFRFSRDVLATTPDIVLESVVDEYSASIKVDGDDCDYIETRNLAYKDAGHQLWKFYSCDWFIKETVPEVYPDIYALLNNNKGMFTWNGSGGRGAVTNKLFYVTDIDRYFILRAVSREFVESRPAPLSDRYDYKCVLQPVNEFGERTVNPDEDADSDEIEFVPACIDHTDDKYGFCLFLNFGSYSESATNAYDDKTLNEEMRNSFRVPGAQQRIESGEKGDNSEYYSLINIAYYPEFEGGGKLPCPLVSDIRLLYDTHQVRQYDFSLRLNDKDNPLRSSYYKIDPTRKVTFKFLADDIPDPRALFLIKGRRYICEKITATFSDAGMSQLLKGEFFPLLDE